MVLRMQNPEAELIRPLKPKKRKMESKPLPETQIIKLFPDIKKGSEKLERISEEKNTDNKLKHKKIKSAPPDLHKVIEASDINPVVKTVGKMEKGEISEDVAQRYPILKDEALVQKFMNVTMTNNQKGRIRQQLRDSLKGTSEFLLPDVIYSKIQGVLKSSDCHSEGTLRKIRILYNMLKTALDTANSASPDSPKKKKKKSSKKSTDKKETKIDSENIVKNVKTDNGDGEKKDKPPPVKTVKRSIELKNQKPKGPKRYVVFVGNLPPDVNKEKIMQHFSELNECIVNIRIPPRPEGRRSSIAYLELKNEPTYELALSKHHSMLGTKRINVLYTTQKHGKVSKTEAKSKSAKLIALQKAGKLIGSVPANRKRSHRRMKMKRAQANLAAENT